MATIVKNRRDLGPPALPLPPGLAGVVSVAGARRLTFSSGSGTVKVRVFSLVSNVDWVAGSAPPAWAGPPGASWSQVGQDALLRVGQGVDLLLPGAGSFPVFPDGSSGAVTVARRPPHRPAASKFGFGGVVYTDAVVAAQVALSNPTLAIAAAPAPIANAQPLGTITWAGVAFFALLAGPTPATLTVA